MVATHNQDSGSIIFNSKYSNQRHETKIEYYKQKDSSHIPILKSNIYRFLNDRAFEGDRIIDTFAFLNIEIAQRELFERDYKKNVEAENQKFHEEFKFLRHLDPDYAEFLSEENIAMNKMYFPPPPQKFLFEDIQKNDKHLFFLEDIATAADFFRLEDAMQHKEIFLIDMSGERQAIYIAHWVKCLKLSPY